MTPNSRRLRDTHDIQQNLAYAVLASILLHLIFTGIIYWSVIRQPVNLESQAFTVFIPNERELRKEPPVRQEAPQIVAPPETKESQVTPSTNQLSDKNAEVEHEQVKRGDGGGPVSRSKSSEKTKASESVPKQAPQPQAPKLSTLKLDEETLQRKFSVPADPKDSSNDQSNTLKLSHQDPQPFSRPSGSGAAFFGLSGTPDYLPNLPDGDVTLLNTKANLFAVFVRRVALQVFSLLRASGWESLDMNDINSMSGFSSVRAVLSPKGEFIRAEIMESSGSYRFDAVLKKAVERGARDANPPLAAAATDGTFRFVFQGRSWARIQPGGRNGAPTERRWLMLGTGLE